MSAAPTKRNVFNPTGPKKEGPSFQSSKPVCHREPIERMVQNPDGRTWKGTGEWYCPIPRSRKPRLGK